MAVKGSIAKSEITQKILSTFDGAFINDKEIRIPWNEDGTDVEIKITMTCAKENIGGGVAVSQTAVAKNETQGSVPVSAPTQKELDDVRDIMSKLNL